MKEVWKDIEGYEGHYQVSNFGRVKSIKRFHGKDGHVLHQSKQFVYGYPLINLCKNNKWKTVRVHRLVAKAFLPKVEGKDFINHIDSNRMNSSVDNLEWCDQKDNMRHASLKGNLKKGENHPYAKLNEEKVREIRKSKLGLLKLSQKYGVATGTINGIRQGRGWKHVI